MIRESKEGLIADIERRLADKIIEKENADLLIKLINNADDLTEAINIASLGTTYKRTGFHFDKRLEPTNKGMIKYFKKNDKLSFSDEKGGVPHKLIIGDNYDALLNLLIEYKGKIDVIYIDPPYGKDKMGEFAKTNYENAITRDNLLSMLHSRLYLAKQLLSDEGVIFCSIDDKNQAYIKCLMDEIFDESNFIATFCRKTSGGKQDSKTYSAIHEYVLCYCRNSSLFVPSRQEKELEGYDFVDSNNRAYKTQLLRKWGDGSSRIDRPNLYYPIYYSLDKNKFSIERTDSEEIEIYPMINEVEEGRWRWEKKTMQKAFDNEKVEVKVNKGKYIPYERIYKDEVEALKPFTTWLDNVKNDGQQTLNTIFECKIFDYPKSIDLIMTLLQMVSSKNGVVLDFFAGSGTTGQAVNKLNQTDGGNRQFICVQLPENLDTSLAKNPKNQTIKNQIELCDKLGRPHNLAEITVERLRRIMTGKNYNGNNDFTWIKNNTPYGGSLDVYEIKEVSSIECRSGKSAFDVIDETLYGKDKFTKLEDKINWVCNNFEGTQYPIETDAEWKKRVNQSNGVED